MQGVNDIKKYLTSNLKLIIWVKLILSQELKLKNIVRVFALCHTHHINKVISKFKYLRIKKFNILFDVLNKLTEN